jgi:uncharacterized repeat protein (TIGR01451 family)
MLSPLHQRNAIARLNKFLQSEHSAVGQKRKPLLMTSIAAGFMMSIGFLSYAAPAKAGGTTYCQSPYGEVYGTVAGTTQGSIYAVHGLTGAAALLTTTSAAPGINGMSTDHVNKLVYYGDANKLFAWNPLTNQHIPIANNFSSLLPASYTKAHSFTTLSSGGAAFYNGSLYIGVDGRVSNSALNPYFEIFKVDFVVGSNGQTIQQVTPLDIVGKSGGGISGTYEDWGDFTISDTGIILALTTQSTASHLWKYDLNATSNPYSNLGVPPNGNHQFGKDGDGRLWAMFASPAKVQQILLDGTYTGTANTTLAFSDGGECVIGNSTVGDRVWEDTNGNGLQDPGEPGIAGAQVSIYRDLNKNGVWNTGEPLLATQTTNASGNYSFTELLPHAPGTGSNLNDFLIQVTGGITAGYTSTTGTIATITPPTSASTFTGPFIPVDLSSASQTIANVDFGYKPPIVVAAPDLTIAKTHAQSFSAGGIGLYQMTVSNIGSAPSAGTITVADTLPAGLSVNSGNAGPVATSGVDAANWTCTSNGASPQIITCQSSAVIPKTVGTSAFQFYVNVSASATVGANSITNTVTVAGGGDTNATNNNASDPTTVTAAPSLSCGPLYGIFGSTVNSLQIYDPTGPSLGTSITTVTGRSVTLGISPLVDSNGRRRIYYLNLDAAANTSNLYYYDGITHVNTGVIVPDSPNRMGFSLDGVLYMSSKAASGNQIIYRYDPATNNLTGPITITDNPNNSITIASSGGTGDLAFDANGVMYLVTGNPFAPTTEFRLYRIDNATTATPVATLIDTAPTTSTTTSLGFAPDGQVYLISNGGRNWRWNLGTGTLTELSALGSANAGFDLASCAYPTLLPSLIANKTVTKVAGSSGTTVTPGDILEYAIVVRNVGSLISAGTTLQDDIPTGTTYVASSTSMNGTSIADNTGGVMPFVATRLINGPGQVSGSIIVDGTPAVTNDNEAVIKFRVIVNTSNPPTLVSNRATVTYVGGSTGGISTDDPTTPDNDPTDVPVSVVNHPNVLLVKRITAIDGSTSTIGGDNLANYKDTASPYDDNSITIPNPPTIITDPQPDTENWPDPTAFLLGGTNGGTIKPNHEMDYTIYFLSAGDQTAKSVVFCDMIPENQAFVPTAFNNVLAGAGGTIGGDRGIVVSSNGISQSYTNLSDGDIAHYYAPGEALPGACRKLPTDPIPSNDHGAIVVNLGDIPAATSPSTPDSYGFVRFRVKVR